MTITVTMAIWCNVHGNDNDYEKTITRQLQDNDSGNNNDHNNTNGDDNGSEDDDDDDDDSDENNNNNNNISKTLLAASGCLAQVIFKRTGTQTPSLKVYATFLFSDTAIVHMYAMKTMD